jgi:hypothetical protein
MAECETRMAIFWLIFTYLLSERISITSISSIALNRERLHTSVPFGALLCRSSRRVAIESLALNFEGGYCTGTGTRNVSIILFIKSFH